MITVIDMSEAAPQKPRPFRSTAVRPVRFTEEQAKDPAIVAKQMTCFQDEIAKVAALAAQLLEDAVLFTNATCGTAGAPLTLSHNFGRNALWMILDWRGGATVGGPSLVSDQDDASPVTSTSLLNLRSYVAGTAAILVF